MQHDQTIELGQQALMTTLTLIAPILLVAILLGLLIGVLQAMTQVQDQTVAFVPKILAMAAVLVACLPWLLTRMVDFTRVVFENAGSP